MKLPNADRALVDQMKTQDYLLNPAHPDNAGKARFFAAFGFGREDWGDLAGALRDLAAHGEITATMETAHGVKYVVDGEIEAPDGRSPAVRSIWIIDRDGQFPRLVTAYPGEK